MKYRKLPIIIEAIQWFKNGDHPEDDCKDFVGSDGKSFPGEGAIVRYYRTPECDGKNKCNYCEKTMHYHGWIDTVQGGHLVCPGDWIITDSRVPKGKHGHYYPCKPDVFEKTYESLRVES